MIRFLTLFPKAENVHLIKDVGMIPYNLSKQHKLISGIASYENGQYTYLKNETKGLIHVYIKRKYKSDFLNVLLFLLNNYRRWDVLQCYHISRESVVYLFLFKFLKLISFSKSITFLKFDSNEFAYTYKLNFIVKFLLKKINILSVESRKLYDFYSEKLISPKNLYLIPNGFNICEKANCSEKKEIIITVGRIGNKEKNNEYLLEEFVIFSRFNINWKLKLIGPIEPDFHLYINDYFKKYPHLKSRVEFTGNIKDREQLNKYYYEAKIFVLTSPMEGFPLVYLEALSKGCYIITPEFSSAIDITNAGLYGDFFENNLKGSLSSKLLSVVKNENLINDSCEKAQIFANENFTWEKICCDLIKIIEKF